MAASDEYTVSGTPKATENLVVDPPVDYSVTLRVISPCEHGIEHGILEVIDGATFCFPECKDSRGVPRVHEATKETYPLTKRRR